MLWNRPSADTLSLQPPHRALERRHFASNERDFSFLISLQISARFWSRWMKILSEEERFQKWERSLNFKASNSECRWAIKKGRQLDLARLTKWPSTVLES